MNKPQPTADRDIDLEALHLLFKDTEAQAAEAPESGAAESEQSPGIPARLEELYPRCVELVRSTGKANTSLFQRNFHIGYAKAALLLDMLETRGDLPAGSR